MPGFYHLISYIKLIPNDLTFATFKSTERERSGQDFSGTES